MAQPRVQPGQPDATIAALTDGQDLDDDSWTETERLRRTIADCDHKLARYRAALEAGTDPTLVAGWTAEINVARVRAEHQLRQHTGRRRMTDTEIRHLGAPSATCSPSSATPTRPTRPLSTGSCTSGWSTTPQNRKSWPRQTQARNSTLVNRLCPRPELNPNYMIVLRRELQLI